MKGFSYNEGHMDELINELSELCGILPEYWDITGEKHTASIDTKKAMLRSMKLKIDSVNNILGEIDRLKWKPWKTIIEPVHVMSVNDQPLKVPIYIPIKDWKESKLIIKWSLENENGLKDTFMLSGDAVTVSEQKWIEGIRYIKLNLMEREHRDVGYYTFDMECIHTDRIFQGETNRLRKNAKIIITPDTCYMPPQLQEGKAWGLSINLYSIRSAQNWGIGDLSDFKKVVRWIAGLKANFVGINPLHAIPNTSPFGLSPYSPISRLYKNYIYLDIENIPEISCSEDVRIMIRAKNFNKELDKLKEGDLIDYEKVASQKERILRIAFDLFYKKHYSQNTSRDRDFRSYISEEGDTLESFALYMALASRHSVSESPNLRGSLPLYSWLEWPEEYRNISGKAVETFREENKKEILFYKYIQWLIDKQLKETAEEAKNLGMSVGLYYDLAIGSVSGGSDAWSHRDVIADSVDVGAPPDDFSPDGQNWGFPPLIPEKLKETGYELFIQTIRKNMKYGGALRIDHALGMFRLFWIPKGLPAKEGAYIHYPSDDLLRIIALESVRNRTAVIAEDLGTMGESVRETLQRFHMLSYRLFYFERNYPDPSFAAPDKYPELALCAVTTHDLPTIYGYWKGQDIEVRKQLGKYSDNTLWHQQLNERQRDRGLILSALESQGIIPHDYPSGQKMIPGMTQELCLAIYQYLSLTPCKLLLISLDDIIGTLNQQNMPGTINSYPNWRQRTPLTLEEILSDKRFLGLSEMLKKKTIVA
jgi:4-alpha-glucanotransferase